MSEVYARLDAYPGLREEVTAFCGGTAPRADAPDVLLSIPGGLEVGKRWLARKRGRTDEEIAAGLVWTLVADESGPYWLLQGSHTETIAGTIRVVDWLEVFLRGTDITDPAEALLAAMNDVNSD